MAIATMTRNGGLSPLEMLEAERPSDDDPCLNSDPGGNPICRDPDFPHIINGLHDIGTSRNVL